MHPALVSVALVVGCVQLAFSGTCPTNWRAFDTMCYMVSSRSDKVSWPEAQQRCRNKGGNLAEPRNARLNTFISDLTNDRFWIGLSDLATEGKYQWDSDTTVLGAYRSWDRGQPDNYKGQEDCIETNHYGGRHEKWNDQDCTKRFRYACQKPQCLC